MSQATLAMEIAETKRMRVAAEKALARKRAANAPPAPQTPSSESVNGTVFIRKGQSVLSGEGFRYGALALCVRGALPAEEVKNELGICEKLQDQMNQSAPGWNMTVARKRLTVPFCPAFLKGYEGRGMVDDDLIAETTQRMWGVPQADPDEVRWASRKFGVADTSKAFIPDTQKVGGITQSWIQQNLGGALVPFPEMGPLIPLLRNKSGLMNSGCTVIPLPPSGRIAFPRQTAPTIGYWLGEGTSITQSNVNTDQFTLSAKKVAAFLRTNNELIRFGGPVAEQMFRNDMTVTLGLTLDYAGYTGEGSDNVPCGLLSYPGVQTFLGTGNVTTTNGYTLAPQDLYTMVGNVMAANAEFTGWIIRPELLAACMGKRASVLATGDGLGLFLFDILRDFDTQGKRVVRLGGFTAVESANVPANRVRSGGTNLTALFGGWWPDFYIGMYGTIEFATPDQGDTAFQQDQTLVRAILSADLGPRHPGAFIVADMLLPTTVGS